MVQFSARSTTAALFTFVTVLAFVLGTTTSGLAAGLQFRKPPLVRPLLSEVPRFWERAWARAPENGLSAKPSTDKGIRTPGLVVSPYL